jgi:hypothetical protein
LQSCVVWGTGLTRVRLGSLTSCKRASYRILLPIGPTYLRRGEWAKSRPPRSGDSCLSRLVIVWLYACLWHPERSEGSKVVFIPLAGAPSRLRKSMPFRARFFARPLPERGGAALNGNIIRTGKGDRAYSPRVVGNSMPLPALPLSSYR